MATKPPPLKKMEYRDGLCLCFILFYGQKDQTVPEGTRWCAVTCWVPDGLPVQVAVFFSDPSAESMVKVTAVYENTCKEVARKIRTQTPTDSGQWFVNQTQQHIAGVFSDTHFMPHQNTLPWAQKKMACILWVDAQLQKRNQGCSQFMAPLGRHC